MEQRSKNVTVIFDMSGTLMRSWIFMRMHLEPETYGCYFQIQNANKCNCCWGSHYNDVMCNKCIIVPNFLSRLHISQIKGVCHRITVFENHRKSLIQHCERSILSGMVHFGKFLKTWSLRSNSVTRQVNFNTTKISGKCQH